MKLICEVEGCGNELSEHCGSKGGLMICGRCRNASYTARRNGLAWARARRENLTFWNARLEYFEPRILKITNQAKRAVAEAKARARVALAKPKSKSAAAALH
jgi:hypothetical protein